MVAKPPAAARAAIDRWFPHRRAKPEARVRLVCFPFAGGGASTYRTWGNELPGSIEVWAVELPGRETRFGEPIPGDVGAIVGPVVDELLSRDERPIALFGHSLGAMLAFETARVLCERERPPIWLFPSGARGPDVPRRNEPVHDLPDAELVAKLAEYQGTPREVLEDRELVSLLLPLIRGDFRLAELYAHRPGPPLPCPISALGGSGDVDVTVDDLQAWSKHTARAFTRHLLPGNHFFIASARADILRLVAERLSAI